LKEAYTASDLRMVRRVSVLLGLAKGETVARIVEKAKYTNLVEKLVGGNNDS